MNNELSKRFISSIVILPVVFFLIIKGSTLFVFFLSILFLISSYEWVKISKKNFINSIIGILFLILSFYSAFKLRENYGSNFFLFVLLVCISTDLGGYFFGKFFKGPKLTKISPKKTYSGVFGSFVLPILLCLTYNYFINLNYSEILNLNFILLILLISLISQLGDLIISYFKRLANVKDTGNILPGHGGILDRIDGLIFVIPFLFIFTIL